MLKSTTKTRLTIALVAGAITLTAAVVPARAETVLRFATTLPEQVSYVQEFLVPWAEKVTADSDGELRIEVLNGPTIANARNVYERVASGVVDIAWGVQGGFGVPFPKTKVTALPFAGNGEQTVVASVSLWKLYESGLLDDEYQDVKPLGFVVPGISLHSSRPILSLEDLQGVKVGVAGAEPAEIVKLLGGAPVAVTVPELYQSTSTGVIDAVTTTYSAIMTFKLFEVVSEHLEVNLGGGSGMIFMNNGAYAGLSEKAKAAIDANSGLVASEGLGKWFQDNANKVRETLAKMDGQTIHTLSDEETARWKEVAQPFVQDWIARTENGQEVYNTYNAAFQDAQKNM